jgi:hypothetical protein
LSPWTPEEESLLRSKYEEHGPQWSIIEMSLPNRSAVNVKISWTTTISRQSRDTWDTRMTIPSESNHSDPTVQTTSLVVIVSSMDNSSQFRSQITIIPPSSPSPQHSLAHVTTGINESIKQENKNEHPMDIFGRSLLQNSQFPMSDMFAESIFHMFSF